MLLDRPTSPGIIPSRVRQQRGHLPGDRLPGRRLFVEYQRVALSGYCLLRHDEWKPSAPLRKTPMGIQSTRRTFDGSERKSDRALAEICRMISASTSLAESITQAIRSRPSTIGLTVPRLTRRRLRSGLLSHHGSHTAPPLYGTYCIGIMGSPSFSRMLILGGVTSIQAISRGVAPTLWRR